MTKLMISGAINGCAQDAQAIIRDATPIPIPAEAIQMVSANSPTTLERVQTLLQAHFSLAPEQVHADTPLADLGIDSLAAIEFMFELENQFKVSLSDERTELVTVADIVAVVEHAFSSASKPA
ncbi:MAG TPA: acyl carrier protein [Burkholderiales bacterium]